MIVPTLMQKIGEAMKAHDAVRVSTLRGLSAEFKNAKIDKRSLPADADKHDPNATEQAELTEAEELAVVRKEAKKRKEAIEMYIKGNATEQAENEKAELTILQEFLPAEVTEEEMNKLVEEAISETNASGMQDMGKVISLVKSKNSNVDGSLVAQLVKQKLS